MINFMLNRVKHEELFILMSICFSEFLTCISLLKMHAHLLDLTQNNWTGKCKYAEMKDGHTKCGDGNDSEFLCLKPVC